MRAIASEHGEPGTIAPSLPILVELEGCDYTVTAFEELLQAVGSDVKCLSTTDAPVFDKRTGTSVVDHNSRKCKKTVVSCPSISQIVSKMLCESCSVCDWWEEWRPHVATSASLLSYSVGDAFSAHRDFVRLSIKEEVCAYTMIIGLHTPSKGGNTVITLPHTHGRIERTHSWCAHMGSALLFDANLLHCAAPVKHGVKEVLVCDVLFVRQTNRMAWRATTLSDCIHTRLDCMKNQHGNAPHTVNAERTELFRLFFDGQDVFDKYQERELRATIDYTMCGLADASLSLNALRRVICAMQRPGAVVWSTDHSETKSIRKLMAPSDSIVEITFVYVQVYLPRTYPDEWDGVQPAPFLAGAYLNRRCPIAVDRAWSMSIGLIDHDAGYINDDKCHRYPTLHVLERKDAKRLCAVHDGFVSTHVQIFGPGLYCVFCDNDDNNDEISDEMIDRASRVLPIALDAISSADQHGAPHSYMSYDISDEEEDDDDYMCNDEDMIMLTRRYYKQSYVSHAGKVVTAWVNARDM